MKSSTSPPIAAPPPFAAALVLAAGAVWAPLAFGSSSTWARFGVEITMAAAACIWAGSGRRPVWLTTIPVIVAGSLFSQLVPLPESLLVAVAPVSAGAWKVAMSGMPATWGRVTLDPAATLTGIRTLFVFLAATFAIIDMARHQRVRRLLLMAIAVSGVLILLIGAIGGRMGNNFLMLGLIDIAGPLESSWSQFILPSQSNGVGVTDWVEVAGMRYNADPGFIGGCVGLFRYGNHFAAAICLTLPVVFSVWIWATAEKIPAWLAWAVVGIGAGVAMWAVAEVAGSRAGAGALVLALFSFVFLAAPLRPIRVVAGFAMVSTIVALLIFLILIFMPTDAVLQVVPEEHKKTVGEILFAARAGPARVAMRAFAASPLLGTGLDTFRYVFPRFYNGNETLFYAHNELAQLLAEAGALGVLWLAAMIWYFAPKATRFWRDASGQYRVLNAGPWAALIGIAAHSAFDWDLHLAANALLTCIVVGLNASSVPATKMESSPNVRVPEPIPRWLLLACCALSSIFLFRDAVSETVQRHVREAIVADRMVTQDPKREPADHQLAEAIAAGEEMVRWDPGDSSLMACLGQAQLHLAARQPPGPQREFLLGRAEQSFRRALSASAMSRGLPESARPIEAR